MIKDFISNRIGRINDYAKDSNGDICYDIKFKKFVENLISDNECNTNQGERYLDYYDRLSTTVTDQPLAFLPDNDMTTGYVSRIVDSNIISKWKPLDNVFISAGTGRGKNTFVKEQLLTYYSSNNNIVILENRESLLSQQKIDLIRSIDTEALQYYNIEKDNMVLFGSNRNIMIISYQKAAIKLLNNDKIFCDFLAKARYIVFDEIHYLLDDSMFNKGVNIIADYLLSTPANTQYATKIFMSGSMEEIFAFMQICHYFREDMKFYNMAEMISQEESNTHFKRKSIYDGIPKAQNKTDKAVHQLIKDIRTAPQGQDDIYFKLKNLVENNKPLLDKILSAESYILNLPTDYSYIKPFIYEEYEDLTYLIKKDNNKWLIFINSKAKGADLAKEINNKVGKGTAVFINADNKSSKDIKPFYESLLNNEKFDYKVLIATNVIYNGINIKDKNLKHIVIPETTVPIMKQLIGRKRINDEDNEVNVYFPKSSQESIQKKFSDNLKQYFEIMNSEVSTAANLCAINGLVSELSKYVYAIPQFSNGNYTFNLNISLLASYKLSFDTIFYLYVLHKFNTDEFAYVKTLLEHLGIENKFDEANDVTAISQEDKLATAKKELSDLLEQNVDKPIVDISEKEYYPNISEFTVKFGIIYSNLHNKSIADQWRSAKRTLTEEQFNSFINELNLDYVIEISKKDRTTHEKTLTVKHKEEQIPLDS